MCLDYYKLISVFIKYFSFTDSRRCNIFESLKVILELTLFEKDDDCE